MASCSAAALLIGGGAPEALAASCAITPPPPPNPAASIANPSGSTINCINIQSFTVTGNVTNAGTIQTGTTASPTTTGISINNSTVGGTISNSGTISARIADIVATGGSFGGGISSSGTMSAGVNNINIDVSLVSMFGGGITNSGTLSVGGDGIFAGQVSTFTGGISNTGTISVHDGGIFLQMVSTFSGGVNNGGTISAGVKGITVLDGSAFSGGIGNSGTISAGSAAIDVQSVSTFGGGISNSGIITAGTAGPVGAGIAVSFVSTFTGGLTNSGMIAVAHGSGIFVGLTSSFAGGVLNTGNVSAGSRGIFVAAISTFAGGVSNAGTISAANVGILAEIVSTFTGGINNSGTIAVAHGTAIFAGVGSSFGGGITNSGTISAAAGIVLGGGANAISTFTGPIVNSGNITGTGGTAIDVSGALNAITIDQLGGTISGAILLSPNADVLNVGGGAIAGNITGSGTQDTVNFALGAGNTFTYSNTISGVNTVNLNSGTVVLDGTITASSAVNVNAGATLSGTGTVDPNVIAINNGATFAPGTAGTPGSSMTIAGNLTFQMNAAYVVYLNPSTTNFATVTGTAALNGTVEASFAAGAYMNNKAYDILHSSGLNGTTFNTLVTNGLPSNFTASLSYTSTDVFLTLTAAMGLGSGTFLNENQQAAATAINNFFNSGGTLPPGFASLFGLTGANFANALTAIDGENATGAERGAFDLMNQFLNLMLDPYVDGRGGVMPSGQALGFAPDQQESLPPEVALAFAGLPLKAPPASRGVSGSGFEQRWTAWGAGFAGSATTNGNAIVGSNDVTTGTYGYAGGMDYHYSPDTVLGFALAGGGTNWSLAQGLGAGRSNAFLAGIYGVAHDGPAYVAGTLAFANNWFTTNRTALGDELTATFQGQSYAARLEGGYRFGLPTPSLPSPASAGGSGWGLIGVTPYAAIQAQTFHTPAYSETDLNGGGFELSYAAMNGTDTRSELGGRFDDLTALDTMPLIVRAKVAWAHDWASNPALNAAFESLPGTSFTVLGASIPHDSALTSAGVQLFLTPNWSWLAKFDGEFAKGSQSYAGSGTLRYTW